MIEDSFSSGYNYENEGVQIKLTSKEEKESRVDKYKFLEFCVILENLIESDKKNQIHKKFSILD